MNFLTFWCCFCLTYKSSFFLEFTVCLVFLFLVVAWKAALGHTSKSSPTFPPCFFCMHVCVRARAYVFVVVMVLTSGSALDLAALFFSVFCFFILFFFFSSSKASLWSFCLLTGVLVIWIPWVHSCETSRLFYSFLLFFLFVFSVCATYKGVHVCV